MKMSSVHVGRQILNCSSMLITVLSRDTNINTGTSDTEVLVLAISRLQQVRDNELWTAFGTRKQFRYVAIHGIALKLGVDKCKALPSSLPGVTRFLCLQEGVNKLGKA